MPHSAQVTPTLPSTRLGGGRITHGTGMAGRLSPAQMAAGAALLVCLGSLALFPLWVDGWTVWSNDPLRSFGALLPPASLALVLYKWRMLDWRMDGSYWGLLLVAPSILAARFFSSTTLVVVYHGRTWGLLHPGVVLFLYGAGATLLFGGTKLLRKAFFPLCLLLLINPVPRLFNTVVDLPLQFLSANTARAFAHAIGLRPTGVQLQMMFAPDFGMMIVPGCNGVRGSVTLGYLALIFGYTRRLRPLVLAAFTVCAVLLGYAFNLVRLCVLVLYYRVGLSWTSIQKYGVEVDYCIGVTLFIFATLMFGLVVRRYQRPQPAVEAVDEPPRTGRRYLQGIAWRAGSFAVLTLLFLVPQLHSIELAIHAPADITDPVSALPRTVGRYTLVRTWTEHFTNQRKVMASGEYVGSSPTDRITLGLWLIAGQHFVYQSKLERGLTPEWYGAFQEPLGDGRTAKFVSHFYNDGVNRTYDAETICSATDCGEHYVGGEQPTMIFVTPRLPDIAFAPASKRLPILLQREWADESTPAPALRAQFERDARDFVANLDTRWLVDRVGR